MSDIQVNHQQISWEIGPKTWGDVLSAVDARAAADGHVVTAVRFAGVDQPSFRDLTLSDTSLAETGAIEVETVPRVRLVRTTLGTAGLSLPDIAAGACRAAAAFRSGDVMDGQKEMGVLLATVRTLVELTLATAAAARTDLSELQCGDETAVGVLGGTGIVLDTLAHHQRAEDWVAVADDLEYALAPSLLGWSAVFEAIDERCAA